MANSTGKTTFSLIPSDAGVVLRALRVYSQLLDAIYEDGDGIAVEGDESVWLDLDRLDTWHRQQADPLYSGTELVRVLKLRRLLDPDGDSMAVQGRVEHAVKDDTPGGLTWGVTATRVGQALGWTWRQVKRLATSNEDHDWLLNQDKGGH